MAAVLAGENPSTKVVDNACDASPDRWRRALVIEGCAVQLERALRASRCTYPLPTGLQRFLRDAAAHAVRQSLTVPAQVAEIGDIARRLGIRLMVLKGTARLLAGTMPGGRSISDIDLLAAPRDAGALHASLRERLGYQPNAASPEHHLPALTRPGALPIEVHIQLGPRPAALDARIWCDAQAVAGWDVLIPSPIGALLHALDHGALVHWALRYRLRDLLDVAGAWTSDVDSNEIAHHIRAHRARAVLMTMLGGARRFAPGIPFGRRGARRTVRRVAWARHSLAAWVRNPARAESLCIAAGVLAEASPRALLRPVQLALFGVKPARIAPAAMSDGRIGTA